MIASWSVLNIKYRRVIEALARERNITLRQALDVFYKSRTYKEMRLGLADMHCRSELYLVEEIRLEEREQENERTH
jgi:hypothetical protein